MIEGGTDPDAGFALDLRLAAETTPLCDLGLSQVLLRNDARFLWLLLVPRRSGLVEITDLPPAARTELMSEIGTVTAALKRLAPPSKINIGALGNIVRQLHIHVVARDEGDPAWPGPVWGVGERVPMGASELAARAEEVRAVIASASQD